MTPITLTPHPRSSEIESAIKACLHLLAPFNADVFRMAEAPYANERDIISGEGSAKYGQRWNPPGILTAYACLDETLAMLERKEQRRKAGFTTSRHLPITQVTIIASLHAVLDFRRPPLVTALGLPFPHFLAESHANQNDGDPEILAQAFGRIATHNSVEAIIVPSAPDPSRYNLVVYRPNLQPGSSLHIHGKEHLPPPP